MNKNPRVAILGRPNVGKSTLFNRICGRRRALVGNEPGMTRDRIYAPAEWMGKNFEVVDTGGMIPETSDLIASETLRHAKLAIDEAEQLVLVVDGRAGVMPLDEELAQLLRRTGKPVALAVNKLDTLALEAQAEEFRRLGIMPMIALSAEHGLGVDDLLEHVTSGMSKDTSSEDGGHDQSPPSGESEELRTINVAIIGHPNVGKSTLLNRLLNQERSIVTPLPGTTRDAVDAELERDGRRYRFIDTAGIRRKGKTHLLAEKLSVIQARKHLERADVALLVLDATEGVTALDTHIGGYAHESGRSVIVVVNKWDAIKKSQATNQEFLKNVRQRMKYLDYAPVVFISALRGQRLGQLLGTIAEVAEARRARVSTAEINRFLQDLTSDRVPTPPGPKRKPFRIYYLTQASVAPPTFIVFGNQAGKLHFSLERFLANRIRERFGFHGTPIVIKSRQSK